MSDLLENLGNLSREQQLYMLQHLAMHLLKADRIDDLNLILTNSPDWMRARHREGEYLQDIELALDSELSREEICPISSLRLLVAKQLASQQAEIFDDEDLETLVYLNRVDEALGYARYRELPKSEFSSRGNKRGKFNGLLTIWRSLDDVGLYRADLLEEIYEVADLIEDEGDRGSLLDDLVIELIEKDYLDAAWRIARTIEDDGWQSRALQRLLAPCVESGQLTEAKEVVSTIGDGSRRADGQSTLAVLLAQNEEFDEAEEVANQIEDQQNKAWALYNLGSVLSDQDASQASSILQQAKEIAGTLSDKQWQAIILRLVASIEHKIGDAEARSTFKAAEKAATSLEDAVARAFQLRLLTCAMLVSKEPSAREVIEKAFEATYEIRDVNSKIRELIELAKSLYENGFENIDDILNEASKIILEIEDEWSRNTKLSEFITTLSEVKRFKKARKLLEHINNNTWYRTAITSIAVNLAGEEEFDRALEVVNLADSEVDRGSALKSISESLYKAGRYQSAIWFARAIEHKEYWGEAMVELASELAALEDERADVLFEEIFLEISQYGKDLNLVSLQDESTELMTRDKTWGELYAFVNKVQSIRYGKFFTRNTRNSILKALAEALSKYNRPQRALEIIQAIDDAEYKVKPLLHTIEVLEKKNNPRTECVIEDVLAAGRSIDDAKNRGEQLRKISNFLAKRNDARASDILNEGIIAGLSGDELSIIITDHELWEPALKNLAATLSWFYRFEESTQIAALINDRELEEKILLATPFYEEPGKYLEQHVLGYDRELRESIAKELDEKTLVDVLAEIRAVEDISTKAEKLRELAAILAEGEDEHTAEVIQEAETAARATKNTVSIGSSDEDFQELYIRHLAAALASVGYLSEAERLAYTIEDEKNRSRALLYIVKHTVFDLDFNNLDEAERIADGIEEKEERKEARESIAIRKATDGDFNALMIFLEDMQLNSMLHRITQWAPAIERSENGLALELIKEISRIAGWVRPDWHSVYETVHQINDILETAEKTPMLKARLQSEERLDIPIEELRSLLGDDNKYVRRAALDNLLAHDDWTISEDVLDAIGDSDAWVRAAAIRGAQRLELREALPAVFGSLGDSCECVRFATMDALKEWRDRRCVVPLVSAYQFEMSPKLKKKMKDLLVQFADPVASEVYLELLSSDSTEDQKDGITALLDAPDERATPRLIELLKVSRQKVDEDQTEPSIGILGLFRRSQHERHMERVLKSYASHGYQPSQLEKLRWIRDSRKELPIDEIIDLLALLNASEAAGLIEEYVEHEAVFVRESAVKALGIIGNESSNVGLKTALKDENIVIQVLAANSLANLGEDEFADKFLDDWFETFKEESGGLQRISIEDAWALVYFAKANGELGYEESAISLLEILYEMCSGDWPYPQRKAWDILRGFGVLIPNEIFEESASEKNA